jgi:predicted PurR-regulated permease PerM
MQFSRHVHITGGALWRWFVAQVLDSLCVGALWWFGLSYLNVTWAPLWAVLAGLFQFIPHFGPVLTFLGPAAAAIIDGGVESFLWVLALYGAIVVADGLVLQPLIMRRAARVPIWASLIVPIVLSLLLGFWGLLLAAPLLAVFFAYRAVAKNRRGDANVDGRPRQTPPGREITGGVLLSPEEPAERDHS